MQNRTKLYRDGLGILVGMIFGAGVFALPYVFSKAGIFWGVFNFAVAFFFTAVLFMMYAEVAFFTKGVHRFTGYVSEFLGDKYKKLAFGVIVFSYYGALLAYGILGGVFLNIFFPEVSPFMLSVLFLVIAALFSLFRFEKIGTINFYLTIPLALFVIYLLASSLQQIDAGNFSGGAFKFWFLPYGVWLFSLAGFAGLPEVRDIFRKSTLKDFKKVIVLGLILSSVLFFMFIVSVWGVGGDKTTEDALTGISKAVGRSALAVGAVIGLLAIFTSYLAISADMKSVFSFDYNINKYAAWILTVSVPLLLFVLGVNELVSVLGLVGAVGLGVSGALIIKMAGRLRKRFPEYENKLWGENKWLRRIIMSGILIGAVLEVFNILK